MLAALPSRLASFHRWLCRWYSDTQDLHARTRYYARKQGVTERTIYRWLAHLRRGGWIASEQTPGVERRITPLREAPPKPRRFHTKRVSASGKMSGVCQASVSGVSSLIAFDAQEAPSAEPANMAGAVGTRPEPADEVKAVQASPVVNRLLALGVSPQIAPQLVRTHGEAVVLAQLDALPHRNARNRAATLVASVLHRWQLPAGCVDAQRRVREQGQKTAYKALQAAHRAEVDRKRQIALERLSALPEAEKTALEQRAREALKRERPAAARLMLGTRGGAAWVQARMLADLERR
jgi:DNA-binding PadR family transcriptional regulator